MEVGILTVSRRTLPQSRTPSEAEEQLEALCARPACRKPFKRGTGPGHRKVYCEEACRRMAESELRRKRARLRHWQDNVEQARTDIAAYRGDASADHRQDESRQLVALRALERAKVILEYATTDDARLHDELRALYTAVAPLVARPDEDTYVA